MYYVAYDRNFKSIEKAFILESWSRTQRAYDFDDMQITGEQLPSYAEPFFIVVSDRKGKALFSGLASTPEIDETAKKTTIQLKGYMTLMNSDIVIDWSDFSNITTVADLFEVILTVWKTQNGDIGIENITWDVSDLAEVQIDPDVPFDAGTESVQTYDLLIGYMFYYGIWCRPELDVNNKELKFTFLRTGTDLVEIRLKDFGITQIQKSFGDFNKATVYNSSFQKQRAWILTEDNQIAKEDTEGLRPVYPMKNRNFIASDDTPEKIAEAIQEAVMSLAENRYQENFDLDVNTSKVGAYLQGKGFSTSVRIFTDSGEYKILPIGEIQTDSDGKNIVSIGYRFQELTQIL